MSKELLKRLNELEEEFNKTCKGNLNESYYEALNDYINSHIEDAWK